MVDGEQRGVATTGSRVGFGFQCQECRHPQSGATAAPGGDTGTQHFQPPVDVAPAYGGPALENATAVHPMRKTMLGAEGNDHLGTRIDVVRSEEHTSELQSLAY